MNYLEIIKNVISNGIPKQATRFDSNGVAIPVENGTIGTFSEIFRHDMSKGFPLTTLRKMPWRSIRVELEGFIKGVTDKQWFRDRKCGFWDEWCNPQLIPAGLSGEEKKEFQRSENDLGPLGYAHGWRNFGGTYIPTQKINSGLDKTIDIINRDNELCGQEFTGRYGDYVVISYDGKDQYHNNRFTVKFKNSGFVKDNLCKKQITDCNIYDPYYPNVANMGCMGEYKSVYIKNVFHNEDKECIIESLKNQWRQMIQRCYNKNNKSYKRYGGKKIYVCSRWLIFANFLKDVQEVYGWENKLDNWENYRLDKDILRKGYYSKESCLWVSIEENNNYTSNQYLFNATDPDGKEYVEQVGLTRFCREHNLSTKTVEASICNDTFTHNGWKFTKFQKIDTQIYKKGYDQLGRIVNTLKTNPYDRRMVCSAWNPNDLERVALPSCHYSWNVVVYGDKLNLVWHQRSSDLLLGAGANIASYGLLLELLAKEAGLQAGELVGTLADCHIYDNLLDNAKEIITREEKTLPQINIKNKPNGTFSIFDWTWEDVELIDYNPHPAIKMGKVTV